MKNNKIIKFILRHIVAISACTLVLIFGIGYWVLSITTIGDKINATPDFVSEYVPNPGITVGTLNEFGSGTMNLNTSAEVFVMCNVGIFNDTTPGAWWGLKVKAIQGATVIEGGYIYTGTDSAKYMSVSNSSILSLPFGGIWTFKCVTSGYAATQDVVIRSYQITAYRLN